MCTHLLQICYGIVMKMECSNYDELLNLRLKHESDFTLRRFKLKQERKEEEDYSSPAELVPDIPDNSSNGSGNFITKEMSNLEILIKEEVTDADHDNEVTDYVSNTAELSSSIKQEDYDITIKEEWNAINAEDSLIEYNIALEHLDSINQGVDMLKSEAPDINVDDSGIEFDMSQTSEKKISMQEIRVEPLPAGTFEFTVTIHQLEDVQNCSRNQLTEDNEQSLFLDKKKDDSKGQLMLNICRVTKQSHNGKENNDFLDGSNNYESVKKKNSYTVTVSKFRCNKCAKHFKSKSHLNRHEKIHLRINGEPLKVFKCHQCGAQFSRNDTLTRHTLNVHCEIKQKFHACPVCGKCFRSACNVSRHSVVHGKQVRHFCDSCGSSFSQHGDLRRHQAYAHGAEPPSRTHVCLICGKAYAKRTILLRHKASHIRERLLSCEICGREFTRKDCLFSHIKNKHII